MLWSQDLKHVSKNISFVSGFVLSEHESGLSYFPYRVYGVAALSFQAVDQWDAWTWNKRGNENKENGIDSILWGYKENGIGLIMK